VDKNVELALRMTADASDVSAGFDQVGDSAKAMADDVQRAARDADAAGDKIGNLADSADDLDSKSSKATSSLGALSSGFELVGAEKYAGALQGAALATDFLSGAGEALNLVLSLESVQKAKAAAATAVHTAATTAQTAASKAAAAGQFILNAALAANPIGLVVAGIALLVGGLILAYNKSETFRTIVQNAMEVAKAAVGFVVDKVQALVEIVRDKASTVWDGLSTAVGVAKDLIVGYFSAITAPIRTIINLVQSLIDKIKDIDFPDLPDIPFVRTATAAGTPNVVDPFTLAAGAAAGTGAGSVSVTNVNLRGLLDARTTSRLTRRRGLTLGERVIG
jgi:phage-related protein